VENSKKIYFASDFHLGVPAKETSRERELLLVGWLKDVSKDASLVYLVGDIFDFWFEYKTVVPKGHVRLLGQLASMVDSGIKIELFTGNHDMWMFNYLEKEIGVTIHRDPIERVIGGKRFYIGHGDGLGPGDAIYKVWKKIFSNKLCQWMFARIHPSLGFAIATAWSGKSRMNNNKKEDAFVSKDQEWLYIYSKSILEKKHFDYFIFGHLHMPLELKIDGHESTYLNLGEWVSGNAHYAVFDGTICSLKKLI